MSQKQIADSAIITLLENATEIERKFVLEIEEHSRPGPSFTDEAKIEILSGEVEFIEKSKYYNYPCEDSTTSIVIPLTDIVVLKRYSVWDLGSNKGHDTEIFVFSGSKGWQQVDL